jgi:hypothetical protein
MRIDTQTSFRTIVKSSVLLLGLISVAAYVAFQARFLIIGPQLQLTNEPEQLVNYRQITLTGSAANISRLWLNDRPIFTDAQGNFTEALVLENGYTIATVRAEDRYGRETTIKRSYVYTPASFSAGAPEKPQ